MLDSRFITTINPNKSLDFKNLGPYKIIRVINNMIYELDLPDSIGKTFPIFYPWLLYLDNNNRLLDQEEIEQPPIKIYDDGTGDFEVKEIINLKIKKSRKDRATGKKDYLIYRIIYSGYSNYNTRPK